MKVLTLRTNPNRQLMLSGILAFVILALTQISVMAYDFGGGWSSIQLVGQAGVNSWQIVGNSLVDSDLNAGQMPSVSTGAVTASGSNILVNGSITNMGVASSAYVRFNYSYNDLSYGSSTAWQTISGLGSFTDSIPNQSGKTTNVRTEVMVGTVSAYGSNQQLVGISAGVGRVAWVTSVLLGAIVIVLVVACIAYGGIYGTVMALLVAVIGIVGLGLLVGILSNIF